MNCRSDFQTILEKSRAVDACFGSIDEVDSSGFRLRYEVPRTHPRRRCINSYVLRTGCPGDGHFLRALAVRRAGLIVSHSVADDPSVVEIAGRCLEKWGVESTEGATKTEAVIEKTLSSTENWPSVDYVVAVGGGLVLNVASYVAERLGADLILVPTTLLAIADGAGGKVRLNAILDGRCYKHYYKSFYEPNEILVDPRFLLTLPHAEIRVGLVEIAKHALFQSEALLRWLEEVLERLLVSPTLQLKAGLWAAALKQVCLEVDVEENASGSRRILRAGHEISDRIEEESRFQLPHGVAVAIGIVRSLEAFGPAERCERARRLFGRMGLPAKVEDAGWWLRG